MKEYPIFLSKTFFPDPADNRMQGHDDVASARANFLEKRPSNLNYLLSNRYQWMNDYIGAEDKVIEIGAGAGLSKEFINTPHLKLTDYNVNPWIDEKVDALSMPYEDSSLDVIISSHMIHHVATPAKYFEEVGRVLKPGGYLLVHDTHTSLMLRAVMRLMHHDGYSYDVDVFDAKSIANNPTDPWSANAAIPELLFRDKEVFEANFGQFEMLLHEPCEFLTFLISGGVTAKTKTINLPVSVLRAIDWLDRCLVKLAPSLFALSKKVVLRKREL